MILALDDDFAKSRMDFHYIVLKNLLLFSFLIDIGIN